MDAEQDEGGVRYWADIAERPWGRYISAIEARHLKHVLERGTQPGIALDAGCGGGRWSAQVANHGWDVIGYDVAAPAVERSQAVVPSGRFILAAADNSTLPVDDHSVDLVLCIEVRPVVQSSWFAPEAVRVLKPGGQLLVVAWNRCSVRGAIANAAGLIRRRQLHDFYRLSYRQWRKQLRSQGFRVVSEHGLCWMPLGRASNSPLAPMFARIEQGLKLHRLPTLSPWIIVHAERT